MAGATQMRVPVVGVGASAGGIKALQTFFEALPPKVGAAFVVIVHLDPQTRSELPEILAARTSMKVQQVTSKSALCKDCIYVIAPNRQLTISDDEIAAVPFSEPRWQRAPIDRLFRSLAEQHGDGFAVILTGAGSDGAVGLRAVKERGGVTLVQDPAEAEYPTMPRSAIATDAADFVLPVRNLAERLVELIKAKNQTLAGQSTEAVAGKSNKEEEYFRRILLHILARGRHDFSQYKRSTVTRRILRRMQVSRKDTLEDYYEFLRSNPDEVHALVADLLISVTTFFRDPRAYEALSKIAIPSILKDPSKPVRVWVAGCATGEEAYSIGILLLEEAARLAVRPEIQIFGSDMDTRALAIAREGRYPTAIEADLGEERLRRFFTLEGQYYRVKRELRDIVLFVNHSVLKDPPFSRLGLISCRNLLIYLDRDLQQQVLASFHYGLNSDGYLFLGSSESAEHPDTLFHLVDREARLYQSTGRANDRALVLPRFRMMGTENLSTPATPMTPRSAQAAHREALETAAPPSILVDKSYRVLHLSESAGRYLQPSGGPLATDVTELVRQELRFEVRSALHRVFEFGDTILSSAVYVRFNGSPIRVYVHVKPIRATEKSKEVVRAIILFVEGEADTRAGSGSAPQENLTDSETVEHLKRELELVQSRLITTREESEAANEELRAANEELQSINEEARSTAEELETSKEELQSINEELQTVNAELKLKLETVSRTNSDLQNLMAATDFGVLFLDPELRIKRFTPRLTDLFNITAKDTGRPITDFTHQLDYDGLAADAKAVLRDLAPIERELKGLDNSWYLVRFRPYRTLDDKIDGIVVTFVDITERRSMVGALRLSQEKLSQETRLVELSRSPIFVWELNDGILQWNRGSEELYGYSRSQAIGKPAHELLKMAVPDSSIDALKASLLKNGVWKGELEHTTKDGRVLTVESQLELISDGDSSYVLESTRDISQTKTWDNQQKLLLSELSHRVKNTLTVVQSMVHQTWRSAHSREDFIERLDGRIAALATSHNLLMESHWVGADLRSLIEGQLGAYTSNSHVRIHISGENLVLPADIATPFGLVIHELATNAAKYGALSGEKGEVDLSWEKSSKAGMAWLKVVWQERDGPPVRKSPMMGFGSRLIQQGLPGAIVQHEFCPTGVKCTIEVPLQAAEGDGTAN